MSEDALARYRAWESDPGACDDRTRLLVRLLATALESATAPRRIGSNAKVGGSNRVLTMREAADYVGMSYYRFARHYRADWGIPFHRVGARVQFRERDLESFLDRNRWQ